MYMTVEALLKSYFGVSKAPDNLNSQVHHQVQVQVQDQLLLRQGFVLKSVVSITCVFYFFCSRFFFLFSFFLLFFCGGRGWGGQELTNKKAFLS